MSRPTTNEPNKLIRNHISHIINHMVEALALLGFSSLPWVVIVIPMAMHGLYVIFPLLIFFTMWSLPTLILGIGKINNAFQPTITVIIRKLNFSDNNQKNGSDRKKLNLKTIREIVGVLGLAIYILVFASLPWLMVAPGFGYVPVYLLLFFCLWSAMPTFLGVRLLIQLIVTLIRPRRISCNICKAVNSIWVSYCMECNTVVRDLSKSAQC